MTDFSLIFFAVLFGGVCVIVPVILYLRRMNTYISDGNDEETGEDYDIWCGVCGAYGIPHIHPRDSHKVNAIMDRADIIMASITDEITNDENACTEDKISALQEIYEFVEREVDAALNL